MPPPTRWALASSHTPTLPVFERRAPQEKSTTCGTIDDAEHRHGETVEGANHPDGGQRDGQEHLHEMGETPSECHASAIRTQSCVT